MKPILHAWLAALRSGRSLPVSPNANASAPNGGARPLGRFSLRDCEWWERSEPARGREVKRRERRAPFRWRCHLEASRGGRPFAISLAGSLLAFALAPAALAQR